MTPPLFAHQQQILAESGDKPYFAVFWEQGTGKTRLALETMVNLARKGEVDAALVLAPNGVHQLWIQDEIPSWVPGHDRLFTAYYTSSKAATKAHQRMCEQALTAPFPIVAMSYDAFMTKTGMAWVRKFLDRRRVFYVLDESTAIKTPAAKRTKSIVASGQHAPYRRILTGTPITNSPFDAYTQMRFLDQDFWRKAGFQTFTAFKTYFGIWAKGFNTGQQREYEYVVGYRNLPELQAILAPHSSRVQKADVLDLPPKLYSKRYFELTPEQRRIYQEIKEQALTVLATGDLVTVPLVITRLLRLHQVTSNYLPTDGDEPTYTISPNNPRMDCLMEALEEVSGQAIIWARFNMDVDQICERLGNRAVRCDGRDSAQERQQRITSFKAGQVQFLVSKPQTIGVSRGQTLVNANTVVYYNNTFSLEDRLQSEDRAHRSGQTHAVDYVDIVAPGTIDTHIVKALRDKLDVASQITGDQLKEWV